MRDRETRGSSTGVFIRTDPSINCVSNHRATTHIWGIYPQVVVPPPFNLFVKGEKGDAGLDQTGIVIWIDIQDLVHPSPEVNQDRAPNARRCSTIANYELMISVSVDSYLRGYQYPTVPTH